MNKPLAPAPLTSGAHSPPSAADNAITLTVDDATFDAWNNAGAAEAFAQKKTPRNVLLVRGVSVFSGFRRNGYCLSVEFPELYTLLAMTESKSTVQESNLMTLAHQKHPRQEKAPESR